MSIVPISLRLGWVRGQVGDHQLKADDWLPTQCKQGRRSIHIPGGSDLTHSKIGTSPCLSTPASPHTPLVHTAASASPASPPTPGLLDRTPIQVRSFCAPMRARDLLLIPVHCFLPWASNLNLSRPQFSICKMGLVIPTSFL